VVEASAVEAVAAEAVAAEAIVQEADEVEGVERLEGADDAGLHWITALSAGGVAREAAGTEAAAGGASDDAAACAICERKSETRASVRREGSSSVRAGAEAHV
jgi:hypothetical protein